MNNMGKDIQKLEICIQDGIASNMKILPMKKKMYSTNALFMAGQGLQLDLVLSVEKDKKIAYVRTINENESILYLNQKKMGTVEFFINNINHQDVSLLIENVPFKKLDIKGFQDLTLRDLSSSEIGFGRKVRRLQMERVDFNRLN